MTAATRYFPFDAGAGASITEAQWREMASYWLGDGVIRTGNELAVSPGAGLTVSVASGQMQILGHTGAFDTATVLPIDANSSGNPRIDRVVGRLDTVANTVSVEIVKGTPAVSPTAPALTRNSSTWEIAISQVAVANGATSFIAGNLTDLRPLVHPLISGIVFASTTARDVHITSPKDGMVARVGTQVSTYDSAAGAWMPGLLTGAWTTYSPTWGTAGTPPALGNGTLSGRYRKSGRDLDVLIGFVAGSTTTFGTGLWSFTSPSGLNVAAAYPIGAGIAVPASGQWPIVAQGSGNLIYPLIPTASGNVQLSGVTGTVPSAWGTGSYIYLSIRMEMSS